MGSCVVTRCVRVYTCVGAVCVNLYNYHCSTSAGCLSTEMFAHYVDIVPCEDVSVYLGSILLVESNYELMTREPQKNCKKAFYDIFLL